MTMKLLIGLGFAMAVAGSTQASMIDGSAYAHSKQRAFTKQFLQMPMQPAMGHAMQLTHDTRGDEKIVCVPEHNERERTARKVFRLQQSEASQ